MTDKILVYSTFSNQDEAEKIAEILLKKNLIACANILPHTSSIYWWEGEIQKGQEVTMIAKSINRHYKAIEENILAEHSYDCPAILCLSIDSGSESFLNWIAESTASN